MERSRVTRYVRIAVTALSLTACVLLIALWVRSYWWCDIAEGAFTSSSGFSFTSKGGDVTYRKHSTSKARWRIHSIERWEIKTRSGLNRSGFFWSWDLGPMVGVPHWFLLCILAMLSAVPWLPWSRRFSLRTLLIATTLVAVVLGVIVVGSL
jgi:hypothetical protein